MIIAHRGASAAAPENTISSFVLAWQMKVPAVECDIHLTADNQVVVIHDHNAKRTTGVDVNICDASYSQITSLDAGSFKDIKYVREKIPLLADVIDTVPSDGTLFVEIKCGREVLSFLQEIIEKSGKSAQIAIIGFNIDVIAEAKEFMPDIPVYWLIAPEKDKDGGYVPYDSSFILKAKEKNLQGINAYWQGLTRKFIRDAHNVRLKVYAWTVDDISVAKELKEVGIDGITSNKPDLLMKNMKD